VNFKEVTSLFAPMVAQATGIKQEVAQNVEEVKQAAVAYGTITAVAQVVTAIGVVVIAGYLLRKK
jgi:uncharacterized membrane protein